MNSTNDEVAASLAILFDDVLLPMAQRMRENGVAPFPLEPEVRWLSYYVRRKRSAMSLEDFKNAACADGCEFEQRLAAHWRRLGRDELAAQVGRFGSVAVAARLSRSPASTDAGLSPYVYAMF